MEVTDCVRDGRAMRHANEMIWKSLAVGEYPDEIAFFCECDDPRCFRPVRLTVSAYERACAEPDRRLLADAHAAAEDAAAGAT